MSGLPLRVLAHGLASLGAGLLVWLATSAVLVTAPPDPQNRLVWLQASGLGLACAALGLGGALLWRQPASPWRGRARLALGLALAGGLALLYLRLVPASLPAQALLFASVAGMGALAWLACQAMLERGQAGPWLPARLALGLYAGLAMIVALIGWQWPTALPFSATLGPLLLVGCLALAPVLASWRGRGDQAGRLPVLVLLAALPWLLAGIGLLLPRLGAWPWALAALAIAAGTARERERQLRPD